MPTPLKLVQQGARVGYYALRNSDPIWSGVLNREARRVWQEHGGPPGEVGREIVATLQRDGIATTTLGELFPGTDALQALQDRARHEMDEGDVVRRDGEVVAKDSFVRFLYGGGKTYPPLVVEDPGIAECLTEPVLRIAGSYLGSAPKFQGFSLQATRILPPDAPRSHSQLWHRDPDDKRILKMFIYVSDVLDDGDGPFEYVRGSQHGGRWRSVYRPTPPFGRYPPDGEVEAAVAPGDILTCMGKAGTVIFADTTGLHRGSFSTASERIMFTGIFVTAASTFPRNYTSNGVPEGLSPLASYALS